MFCDFFEKYPEYSHYCFVHLRAHKRQFWHDNCRNCDVLRKSRKILYGLIPVILFVLVLPMEARKQKIVVPDSLQRMEVKIQIGADSTSVGHELSLIMQRVEGGAYMMGATEDQADEHMYTDKPAHLVFLSPYYIATTEVTNALWHAIMPEKDTLGPRGYPTNPITYISWYDCQEFVRRLDSITGLPFRLPTEAEWEYAARGGARSKSYRFAGGNEADSVGWIYPHAGNWTHPVGRKHPNELGLYDMTGNVSEWCDDRYGAYQLSTAPNPCGADTGSFRIARGSSYDACTANSHLSVRRWYTPSTAAGYIGFRVAMTLPDDPMLQPAEEEPSLMRTVRLKGKRLKFIYVPTEQPYYISEEVESSLWRKIMQSDPPAKHKNIAIGMSKAARVRFAEYSSRTAMIALSVASAEETVAAEQQGLIEPYKPDDKPKRKKQDVRQTQRKRRMANKLTVWTELAGFRMPKPDDPVLLEYKQGDDESRPLRLVIRL